MVWPAGGQLHRLSSELERIGWMGLRHWWIPSGAGGANSQGLHQTGSTPTETFWLDYLSNYSRAQAAARPYFSRLPTSPRCHLCGRRGGPSDDTVRRYPRLDVDAGLDLLGATGHGDPGRPWAPIGAGVHTGRVWFGAVGEGHTLS